ncbi:MAG: hypothetical protein K2Y32_05145 [Candidatus Obscuribacterales bacterium]|nr:hypothetical protein [Candidatus Obscuribacterales bacterium]
MKDTDRENLREILAECDENFLVALANKGLVRRAQKDIETEFSEISVQEEADAFVVRGNGWTVWMPSAGPAKARDDTKASGVTRQILMATLYLRSYLSKKDSFVSAEQVAIMNGQESAAAELIDKGAQETDTATLSKGEKLVEALAGLDDGMLARWAGKKIYNELVTLLQRPLTMVVEGENGISLTLSEHDIEVRLLPTRAKGLKLLDEILSTAQKAMHKRWVCAAIISLKLERGHKQAESVETDAVEAGIDKMKVLDLAKRLLEDIIRTGLSHLSEYLEERLLTLSISASVVGLPRLSRLLNRLAEEVSLILEKHVSGESQRLLSLLATCYALTTSLRRHAQKEGKLPLSLSGMARSNYREGGNLSLLGLGSYCWLSKSGFEGLTTLFWDAEQARFLTYTASRPQGNMQFSLGNAYEIEPVWSSAAPKILGKSKFVLQNAHINDRGRLSSTNKSTVADLQALTKDDFDFSGRQFDDWSLLTNYARGVLVSGLVEAGPLEQVSVLKIEKWGKLYFEELHQNLNWVIFDKDGRTASLSIPWAPINEEAISFFESLKPELENVNRVVVRIYASARGIVLEPLTLISAGSRSGDIVLNPCFDRALIQSKNSSLLAKLKAKFSPNQLETRIEIDHERDDGELSFEPELDLGKAASSQMYAALSDVDRQLLQIAESGVWNISDMRLARVKALASWLADCGVVELSRYLEEIAGGVTTVATEEQDPDEAVKVNLAGSLLLACYVQKLIKQELWASTPTK